MDSLVRSILGGIAIGGFVATMVEANLIALKALVRLNRCAIEAAWALGEGVVRKAEGEFNKELRLKRDNFEDEDEDEDES